MGTFARIPAACRGLLLLLAQIAKLRAREHVCAFWHAGDARFIDVGGRFFDAFEFLKRMRPVNIAPLCVRITVQRAFGGAFAQPPRRAVGLLTPRGKRRVGGHLEIGCDHGKAKALANIGCKKTTLFNAR